MSQWGYVLAGWGIAVALLAFYGFTLVLRGRRLVRQVPAESQRWMESP